MDAESARLDPPDACPLLGIDAPKEVGRAEGMGRAGNGHRRLCRKRLHVAGRAHRQHDGATLRRREGQGHIEGRRMDRQAPWLQRVRRALAVIDLDKEIGVGQPMDPARNDDLVGRGGRGGKRRHVVWR